MRHAIMNDENRPCILRQPTARITRAQAKALGSSSRLPPKHPSGKQDDKRVLRASSKRAALDNDKAAGSSGGCHQPKKRAVLKDVTNINCGNLDAKSINAAKVQKVKGEDACFAKTSKVVEVRRENIVDEIHKVEGDVPQDICPAVDLPTERSELSNSQPSAAASPPSPKIGAIRNIPLRSQSRDKSKLGKKQESLNYGDIIDIDSRHKDPQMCSLYAADIYSSLFAGQFDRKPSPDYMEKLQQDITRAMRGILIDWLVEVSEEYRLVPDTLYLTVNLIDRFLSENYIEKQKLQLLGVTCMLISSKYEEICAPRVEEFCFITDNTYTKEEVVQMESRILNLLRFQLSVPTAKKFLRRFIQAAQASYEVPSVELEFLANYLAELTLIDYGFLKYLPSLTAASAIFLARWTLDQSDHPWNLTLEHYTKYKASELKNAVLELQDLQLNTNGGMLNAIREKYKQPKFKGVSTLRSARPVQTLFQA